MNVKKLLALLLAAAMMLSIVACSPKDETTTNPAQTNPSSSNKPNGDDPDGPGYTVETFDGRYTYMDSASTISTSWNPFTYETADQAVPLDYTTSNLYSFIFNDELNPVEGQEPYAGYKIVPDMAASDPVDVTEKLKGEAKWGIPATATSGYAYTIDLNPACTWQDGTPIKAVDYVESLKRLLDPKLLNYRADNWYTGTVVLVNAEGYALQGNKVWVDNGKSATYQLEDLTKKDDGKYYTPEGELVYIAVGYNIEQTGGKYSLKDYVNAYKDAYFGMARWEELVALMNDKGMVEMTDDTLAMLTDVTTTNPNWNETDGKSLYAYLVYEHEYPAVDFADVGCYESGEYQITVVLSKALSGFNFYYGINSFALVKTDVYDELMTKTETAGGVVYTTTYNTSVDTTWSYGPYIMDGYQLDKSMHFTRNENWWGYTDGKHVYKDPNNGKYYNMYMTTDIDVQMVKDTETAKLMFFAGELMGYSLQSDDLGTYRSSEFCHFTPGQATYFMILNGYMDQIKAREAAADFDQSKYDLETLSLTSFHRAIGLSYDKQGYCDEFSPSQSPAFGLISNAYIYDPATGAKYRDTDQAKQVLCDVYGVDVSKYASLDEAVSSITGYDPQMANSWYKKAYEEALAAGYITDTNGDGICDQTIKITMANGSSSDTVSTKTKNMLKWLSDCANEAAKGTGFEGRIEFDISAPLGDEWSSHIRNGLKDFIMAGWNGSAMNPFNCARWWTTETIAYDANWVDYTAVDMTMEINGESVTMNLQDWANCLCGDMKTDKVTGKEYNFGEGVVDATTRLEILAAIEGTVLTQYSYLPFTTAGSLALLCQKAFYVIEDYNPVMGRGGIAYMRYNYDDTEWDAVKGSIKY